MQINQSIFKAYDMRGIYPTELNEELYYHLGQAYVKVVRPKGKVAVGMDVRIHSPQLKEALIRGLTDAGIDVVDIGLVSTEMLYFAVGKYEYAGGIQVTASHNPAEYNGAKMVREKAIPISSETGFFEMRDLIMGDLDHIEAKTKGQVEKRDILDDFADYCLNFVDIKNIKPTKLVINPNFGFEGVVFKRIVEIGKLPIEIVGLNDTPDGTFPKGRPDPFVAENRPEFIELVKASRADLGAAWDADADRIFFCTPKGIFVEAYYAAALFTQYFLKKFPGAAIIYDPRYTWAVLDTIKEFGGVGFPERVGHSFIKTAMRKHNAVFCGEASGHTYLRDFYYCDSGILPVLILLEMMGIENKDLDQLLEPYFAKYIISGEYNTIVKSVPEKLAEIQEKYKNDFEVTTLDGVSIDANDWRANIRGSNTEPLLRLNVEAKSQEKMVEKRDELLELIRA
ncbi:MAG: phosphomannomutase/phosphoglucomutase [bacterium]